ncbi:hypothetical protein ACQT33_22220, partial [Klebsiella pneumoniae]
FVAHIRSTMRKKKAPDSAYALQDAFIHGPPNRHWFVARTFIHLISNANGMPALAIARWRAFSQRWPVFHLKVHRRQAKNAHRLCIYSFGVSGQIAFTISSARAISTMR